jgi:phosphate transport system substrate-binding protein
VFPFATAVAEQFGQKTNFPTPVVESTGSGGGMKLFCAGVGNDTPDITNASRRIKSSEFKACTENGITVTEVKIGFDGIVLAQDKGAPELKLSTRQIYLALAKQVPVDGKLVDNPYRRWSDIDPSLPNEKIEVLGPPPTSGTRDAFVELAMESGAKAFPILKELRELKAGDPRVAEIAKGLGLNEGAYMKDGATVKGKNLFRAIAHTLREDGAFVEAGENDNLIVQKLEANPSAVGIFGFSFLDQNADALKGATVNDVEPTFENIASGEYDISRSLYFYVKGEHVGVVPGIKEYIAEFTSEAAWGDDGYLVDKGLIPLSAEERKTVGEAARNLRAMSM